MTKPPKSGHHAPPELDGLSYRAVLDRIEIELTLATPSQWHHLKRRASTVWGNVYVESLEPSESSKRFRLTVQDPRPPDEFMRQVQTLARDGESLLEGAVKITSVEIAIDASHPSNDPDVLARAALHFMRHQAHLPRGLPRITAPPYFDAPILAAMHAAAKAAHATATADALRDGKEAPPPLPKKYGTRRVVESSGDALTALQRGLTINQGKAPDPETGERGDNHRGRHYVKTHDTRDNVAYAPLRPDQYRARNEKTWQDAEVPFTTMEEWRNFRFEALSRRFELVLPNAPTDPLGELMQERTIQFGLNRDESGERPRHPEAVAKSREPGYRHKFHQGTHPDSATNAKISKALWCLTQRSRVKIRKESDTIKPPAPERERDTDPRSPKYSKTNTGKQFESTEQERRQDVEQSLLTMTEPVCGSSPNITHTDVTPRQEDQ